MVPPRAMYDLLLAPTRHLQRVRRANRTSNNSNNSSSNNKALVRPRRSRRRSRHRTSHRSQTHGRRSTSTTLRLPLQRDRYHHRRRRNTIERRTIIRLSLLLLLLLLTMMKTMMGTVHDNDHHRRQSWLLLPLRAPTSSRPIHRLPTMLLAMIHHPRPHPPCRTLTHPITTTRSVVVRLPVVLLLLLRLHPRPQRHRHRHRRLPSFLEYRCRSLQQQ